MIAARLSAQLLSGPPAAEPLTVVERLLAVQGQDPRGARLAIRSRSEGVSATDVDRALTADRSMVISWLNRGTLHLVRSEDYPWLQAITTPPIGTANARRLAQEGVSPDAADRGVAVIGQALAAHGPLNRGQLGERVAAAGVPTAGQALVHILLLASLRGLIVRGPIVEGHHAFVLAHDWLGMSKPVDRDVALAELARRYLAGHGPAGERDLAKWSGLPLRDVRSGLGAIASQLHQRDDGLLELAGRPRVAALRPPRLLGAFDPLLLGWVSREPILGSHQRVVTINGIFRPFALVDGRAVATWSMPGGEVALQPFGPLGPEVTAALEADAAGVKRFLAGAS